METLTVDFNLLQESVKRIHNQGIQSIDELKEIFESLFNNHEELMEDISRSFTVTDLKKKVYGFSDDRKSTLVRKYFHNLLDQFYIKEDLFSYQPFSEKWEDALKREVLSQTQEQLDAYNIRQKEEQEKFAKCMTNPETLEEFRTFIQYRGKGNLTPDQLTNYERLVADQTIKIEDRKEEHKKEVKQVTDLDGVEFSLHQTVHSKKGHNLWVVQLSSRVEKDKYRELNTKAKMLGGYYSKYNRDGAIPGFQFKDEKSANEFMSLKDENVSRADRIEERKEQKQMTASERFADMADRLLTAGQEKLNQDRKTNTERQARMASHAEADAERMIFQSKVFTAISEALKAGELKYMERIKFGTQVELFNQIINEGHRIRMRKEEVPYDKQEKDFDQDINYVRYPLPRLYIERLKDLIDILEDTKGQKLRANRLRKFYNSLVKRGIDTAAFSEYGVNELRETLWAISDSYLKDQVKEQLTRYDHMQSMRIPNIETLKTALREYNSIVRGITALTPEEEAERKIKELERSFIGKKIDGFFPTPKPLVDQMLQIADIQPGEKVLEPSAGLGHIADQIALNHECDLQLLELNYSLSEALTEKGHNVIHGDFLSHNGSYDKIIMNPPFEDLQDIDHVRHAYNLLNEGGRLVAIMAPKFGDRIKVREFLDWLDSVGGYMEDNPAGSFQSAFRPTSVNTVTVVIDSTPSK